MSFIVAVYFRQPGKMSHPFDVADYYQSYQELGIGIEKLGGSMFIVRGAENYLGAGTFASSWRFVNGELVESGSITANVVYDKGRFPSDNQVPIFNLAKVRDMCLDKWKMYQLLHDYCPKTVLVQNDAEVQAAFDQLQTNTLVCKPYRGAEGYGVRIADKAHFFDNPEPLQYPSVLQEFLDTSRGIPGIIEETHDLRVAILDGQLFYSYVRTPPPGSLLANVSKGGTFRMIQPSTLPQGIQHLALEIDTIFQDCPHRFYSIDFGVTTTGPKIIEMNAELGLLPNKDHPIFATLKQKLAQILMDFGR